MKMKKLTIFLILLLAIPYAAIGQTYFGYSGGGGGGLPFVIDPGTVTGNVLSWNGAKWTPSGWMFSNETDDRLEFGDRDTYIFERNDDEFTVYQNGNPFISQFFATGAEGKNLFIGEDAGGTGLVFNPLDSEDGSKNVGVGNGCLGALTNGFANAALGYQSGSGCTTGYVNTFFGYNTGRSVSTGWGNTYIGYRCGFLAETGYWNTAIGYQCGYNNTTGVENNFIGYQAGFENLAGMGNNHFGYQAGQRNQGGDDNICIGRNAGRGTLLNSYDDNIFIGRLTGELVETGSRNILIGDAINLPTLTTDDYISIGDVFTHDGATGILTLSALTGTAPGIKTDGAVFRKVTTVNAATYDLAPDDYTLDVTYTTTGAVTLTLPTAQVVRGREIDICDGGGNAGTNNITIDTEGGALISGIGTFTINSNWQSITLVCNGTDWRVK